MEDFVAKLPVVLGAVAIAAAVVIAIAIVRTPPAGAHSSATATRFLDLRVCSYGGFDKVRDRCLRDERSHVLVSSRFACSVDAELTRPSRIHARMTLNGVTVAQFTTRLLEPALDHPWISENVGTLPLPGGTWGCQFTAGSIGTKLTFRSGGPTGPVINAAVCAAKDLVSFGASRSLRVCRSDESATPIAPTSRIACTAVFVKGSGQGNIELLAGDTDASAPFSFAVRTPLSLAWAIYTPSQPAADGTFTPGAYHCRYSVDGTAAADKTFHIGTG